MNICIQRESALGRGFLLALFIAFVIMYVDNHFPTFFPTDLEFSLNRGLESESTIAPIAIIDILSLSVF